jgi:hypothetical protein
VKRIYLLFILAISLLLTSCGGTSKTPENSADSADPPSSSERLDHAKELLKGVDSAQALASDKVQEAKRQLEGIKASDTEYGEATAILKTLDEHDRARSNPIIWDTVKQIDDRRAALAEQLKAQMRTIDPQIACVASGFGNTELLIRSPKLNEDELAKIQKVLSDTGVAERAGFIKLIIRNDDKILFTRTVTG